MFIWFPPLASDWTSESETTDLTRVSGQHFRLAQPEETPILDHELHCCTRYTCMETLTSYRMRGKSAHTDMGVTEKRSRSVVYTPKLCMILINFVALFGAECIFSGTCDHWRSTTYVGGGSGNWVQLFSRPVIRKRNRCLYGCDSYMRNRANTESTLKPLLNPDQLGRRHVPGHEFHAL